MRNIFRNNYSGKKTRYSIVALVMAVIMIKRQGYIICSPDTMTQRQEDS